MNDSDMTGGTADIAVDAERMTACDNSIRDSINAIKQAVNSSVSVSPKLNRAKEEYLEVSYMDALYQRTADNDNTVLNAGS